MLKYLRNSEISMRLGLNPVNWVWFPKGAYEAPTPIYPKRRTYAIAWLGVQLFLDLDDGTHDMSLFQKMFEQPMDTHEEREVGPSLSKASVRNIDVE